MAEEQSVMEKIVSLCKRRGFVFPGSEIYGGLAGIYDYGPYGVELRHNIKQYFWNKFVTDRDDVYGMGAAILMPERVWEASGHTEHFYDPMAECEKCKQRERANTFISIQTFPGQTTVQSIIVDENKIEQMNELEVPCLAGGKHKWTKPRQFNLLIETKLGASEATANEVYLRGAITQGVEVNFKNILDSMHPKLPFGIGQIGKAFRNEITPRDFLFRQREFEQMELQYYIRPEETEGKKQFEYWKQFALDWYVSLGFHKDHLRLRQHGLDERAH